MCGLGGVWRSVPYFLPYLNCRQEPKGRLSPFSHGVAPGNAPAPGRHVRLHVRLVRLDSLEASPARRPPADRDEAPPVRGVALAHHAKRREHRAPVGGAHDALRLAELWARDHLRTSRLGVRLWRTPPPTPPPAPHPTRVAKRGVPAHTGRCYTAAARERRSWSETSLQPLGNASRSSQTSSPAQNATRLEWASKVTEAASLCSAFQRTESYETRGRSVSCCLPPEAGATRTTRSGGAPSSAYGIDTGFATVLCIQSTCGKCSGRRTFCNLLL